VLIWICLSVGSRRADRAQGAAWVGAEVDQLYDEIMGSEERTQAANARRIARQGMALVLAGGIVAIGHALCSPLARAESSQGYSPLPMTAPAPSTVDPSPEPARPTGSTTSEPKQNGNPLWSLPLSALSVTRERPIFSPSRRPPPPPVIAAPYVPPPSPPPPPAPPEPDHPSLTLLGTLAGESRGVGIFLNESDKTTLHLRTGEGHEGWILRSIRSGEAIFEKEERTAALTLMPLGSAAPAPASSMPFANTWRDGDGQMIGAPQRRERKPAAPTAGPVRSTWLDGDGQMIGPPPASASSPPAVAPTAVVPAL
jgi:general secretion pathway protein N